jgi:hypothetical protein
MQGRPGFRIGRNIVALLVLAGLAVAALLAGWDGGRPAPPAQERAGHPFQSEARGPSGRAWGAAIGFASRERLEEHYRKHGAEFSADSRQDYLRLAQSLRDAPAGGPVLEAVRHDGVITRFDRRSGAFVAFNADGVIRTFFRPNDGERYFRRQLERGH